MKKLNLRDSESTKGNIGTRKAGIQAHIFIFQRLYSLNEVLTSVFSPITLGFQVLIFIWKVVDHSG